VLPPTHLVLGAVEDTAASQRAVPKKITGRAAKLLTWEEQGGDVAAAAATPRHTASASATPARKRQRTAEAPPRSASAPSRRARGTPTLAPSLDAYDGAGAVSDSEGGPALFAAKRRRALGSQWAAVTPIAAGGKQVPLLSGPPRPAAITFAGAEEPPTRRFRSISAIYKAADAEDSGTAQPPARVSSTAAKRTRATPRPGRTPQHSVHAEAQRMADAADTDVRAPQSDNAEQPPRQTPVARITRAAASRPHGSQLVTAEVDVANVLPQAKLPAGLTAAVAVSTRSHDVAAAADDDAAAVTSAARGTRRRTGQRSAQPQPMLPDVGAQNVPAHSNASSDEGQHGQLEARHMTAEKQQQAEAAQEADTAPDAEKLGESAGPSDVHDASASHAAADEEEASDADDSADASGAFLQALAARMLASAAGGQGSDNDGSGAEDELEHKRTSPPEHSGSAAEHGSDSADEFGERCSHLRRGFAILTTVPAQRVTVLNQLGHVRVATLSIRARLLTVSCAALWR